MNVVFKKFGLVLVAGVLSIGAVGCGGAATREVEAPPEADPNAGLMNPDEDPLMKAADESTAKPNGGSDPALGPGT